MEIIFQDVLPQTVGVYLIETMGEKGERKAYVGMTQNSFTARWKSHVRDLAQGKHHNKSLQKAYPSLRKMNFMVLEELKNGEHSRGHFLKREKHHSVRLEKADWSLWNTVREPSSSSRLAPLTENEKEKALYLYLAEGYSQEEIAAALSTIYHRVRDFFVEVNAVEQKKSLGWTVSRKKGLSEEEKIQVKHLYTQEGKTMAIIAKEIKCPPYKIRNLVLSENLDKMRKLNGFSTGLRRQTSHETKKTIITRYQQGESINFIAHELNIPYYDVREIVKKGPGLRKLSLSKEELEELVLGKKLSNESIAKLYGVSESTVKNKIRSHEIKRR